MSNFAELKKGAAHAGVLEGYHKQQVSNDDSWWYINVKYTDYLPFHFSIKRPDSNGDNGGEVLHLSFTNAPITSESLTKEWVNAFIELRKLLYGYVYGDVNWHNCPAPELFDDSLDKLQRLINMYDDYSTSIPYSDGAIDGVCISIENALNRYGAGTMTGSGADAIRKLLDQVRTHRRFLRDFLLILRARLSSEQQIWAAVQRDFDQTIANAANAFRNYQYSQEISLSSIGNFVNLAGILTTAANPPIGMFLSALGTSLTLLIDAGSIPPVVGHASSVNEILLGLKSVLTGGGVDNPSDDCLFSVVRQRESAVKSQLMDDYDTADAGEVADNGHLVSFRLNTPLEIGKDKSCRPSIDIDCFSTILKLIPDLATHMDQAASRLDSVVCSETAWKRAPSLGYDNPEDPSTGAYKAWANLGTKIHTYITEGSETINGFVQNLKIYFDDHQRLQESTSDKLRQCKVSFDS